MKPTIKKNRILAVISAFIMMMPAYGADKIANAADAYEKGDYAKAINLYTEICETDGVSAPLLANLGNAYVKAGDYGKGRICYERSLRIDPSDSEVGENIAYVRSKVEDANKAETHGKKISVAPDDKTFFANVRDYVVYGHSSDTWAVWAGIMFVLTCGCAALYVFTSRVMLRKIGFFGGFAALGLCTVLLIFAFTGASGVSRHDTGVVTGYKVNLRTEPDSDSKANPNALCRGTLLDILQTENDNSGKPAWYKVRLNSDYIGWIQASDFEAI